MKNIIIDNKDGTSTVLVNSKKHGMHHVVIDTSDVDLVKDHFWSLAKHRKTKYVLTTINNKTKYMHALINNTPGGLQTDHIDCNGLNNRRNNLRSVTLRQNQYNRKDTRGCSRVGNRWRSYILNRGKFIYLGAYDTEEEAHARYLQARAEYFNK